jgi:glycosyltransferase involved in cell wall biosynthesis
MVDFSASRHVDFYIANSEEVAGRIKKFYRRDATVIYPPVEVQTPASLEVKHAQSKGDYFLAGGRLARPKHVDLIISCCKALGFQLKVFGKGFAGYGDELVALAGIGPVTFLGEVADEEKWKLMEGAKAYINASEDEDFGILPVEAMAAGTPVIAYRSGGVKETVVEGKTGIFFDELTVESLGRAIELFQKSKFTWSACRKRAEAFSKDRFEQQIEQFITKVGSHHA